MSSIQIVLLCYNWVQYLGYEYCFRNNVDNPIAFRHSFLKRYAL